jgi:hypothetical protein
MSTTPRLLPALLLAAVALTLLPPARAAKPSPPRKGDPAILLDAAATRQAQLKRRFAGFREKLVLLAGRLENGSNADKERAKSLRAAIELMRKQEVEGKFDALIGGLTAKGAAKNTDVLAKIIKDNKELRDDLKKLMDLLTSGNRDDLKARREKATKLLEEIKELRGKQARLRALGERGRHSAEELRKLQEKITKPTQELAANKDKLGSVGDGKLAEKIGKKVNGAVGKQRRAEGKLGRGQTGEAGQDQEEVVADFDDIIRDLEDHINQIRREEREHLLTTLIQLAERMLRRQVEVRDATAALERDVRKNEGRKAAPAQVRKANGLADKEERLLADADSALRLLENEGTSAVFAEAFRSVRKDAEVVRARLGRTDPGKLTQAIEEDIIETLKDVIEALKKAVQDNDQPSPHPGPFPEPDPNNKPRMIEFLAELKMVRALQQRVHDRTRLYGKQYPGEQLDAPASPAKPDEQEQYKLIRAELKDLSARQQQLGKVTAKLADKAKTKEPR